MEKKVLLEEMRRDKKLSVKEILKLEHAILLRRNRHEVWQLPNGKLITLATSASDANVERVQIRLINKLLGVNRWRRY